MTAVVAWPTFEIPSAAVPAWRRLTAALTDRVPPCAADAEVWHSRAADDIAAAADACQTCHALAPCGQYAVAANERSGVWAGHDRAQSRSTARATNHESETT